TASASARNRRPRWTSSFFFQADDGIRDLYVTGVQTCALPICDLVDETVAVGAQWTTSSKQPDDLIYEITKALWSDKTRALMDARSEERRVGKECKSRWSAYNSIEHRQGIAWQPASLFDADVTR